MAYPFPFYKIVCQRHIGCHVTTLLPSPPIHEHAVLHFDVEISNRRLDDVNWTVMALYVYKCIYIVWIYKIDMYIYTHIWWRPPASQSPPPRMGWVQNLRFSYIFMEPAKTHGIYTVLTSSASETVVFAAFCNTTLYTTTLIVLLLQKQQQLLRTTAYYYVLLRTTTYYYVLLRTTTYYYYYVLLRTTTYFVYVLLRTTYYYVLLRTTTYYYVPLRTTTYYYVLRIRTTYY